MRRLVRRFLYQRHSFVDKLAWVDMLLMAAGFTAAVMVGAGGPAGFWRPGRVIGAAVAAPMSMFWHNSCYYTTDLLQWV